MLVCFLLLSLAVAPTHASLAHRVYNGQKTELKLSGLDETMPGTHIFLIYLACLALVFLSHHAFVWCYPTPCSNTAFSYQTSLLRRYKQRNKDPRKKLLKKEKKIELAKKIEPDVAAAASHSV